MFPRIHPTTILLALATMSAPLSAAEAAQPAHDYLAYFGTSRSGANRGFTVAHFDSDTGALTAPVLMPTAAAPNIFVFSADNHRFLYTCNAGATFQGQPGGGVSSFAVEPATGKLTALNAQPSGGGDPGYISLDRTGRFAFVANYRGGSVAVFALKADGSLGDRVAFDQHTGKSIDPRRQDHAYAEAVFVDPSNRFLISTDLGLDKIFVYRFDEKTGALAPGAPAFATVTPGSGPRHAVFHPNGKFLYAVSEMANTVTGFNWDTAKGTLAEFQTLTTLPADFKGNSAVAEVLIHPNGKYLYASNRGHDSLVVFAINATDGHLSLVEHVPTGGKTPRCFSFDPTGQWIIVSNDGSSTAVVFRVDAATGKLTQQGDPVPVPNPLQCQFLAVTKGG